MLWITEEMICPARVIQVMDNHGNKHRGNIQGIPDILSTKSKTYSPTFSSNIPLDL